MFRKMSLATLAIGISSLSVYANQLPDEINYGPYLNVYEQINSERGATENSLNDQRTIRANLLQAIDDQLNYIRNLELQIDQDNQRIGFINAEVPRLQDRKRGIDREISVTDRNIRTLNQEIDGLNRDIEIREDRLRNINREINRLDRDKKNQITKVNNLNSALSKLNNEIANLEKTITENRKKVQNLNTQIQNFNSTLDAKKSQLATAKTQKQNLVKKKNNLTKEAQDLVAKNKTLQDELKVEQQKLKDLRQQGAAQDVIQAQVKVVQGIRQNIRKNNQRVRVIATEKTNVQNQITAKNTQIANLEKYIANAPQELQKLKDQKKALQDANRRLDSQVAAKKRLVPGKTKQLEDERKILADINSEIDRRVRRSERVAANLSELKVKRRSVAQTLSDHQRRFDNLVSQSNDLANSIDSYLNEIPGLEGRIAQSRVTISRTNAQISTDRASERETYRNIKRLENELRVLTDRTNNAYAEYESRENLYNSYLKEAKTIGQSQIAPASNLATNKGSEMANIDGEKYGMDVSTKFGLAQAKAIGLIRGELKGYQDGYNDGYASDASIDAGTIAGQENGKAQAYAYVRRVFKPQYFENHLMALISTSNQKRDDYVSVSMSATEKSNEKEMQVLEVYSEVAQNIEDLSMGEIDASRRLSTGLDSSIETALRESNSVVSLKADLIKPQSVYSAPSAIPYTNVDCSSVYKDVADYIAACEASFKSSFKSKYLNEVYAEYKALYPRVFADTFNANEPVVREQNFDAQYKPAYDMAYNEGDLAGKEDIYNLSYKKAYDQAYAENIAPAKVVANKEALDEVNSWLKTSPIVTAKSAKFASPTLRGGDSTNISIDLKNISDVDALNSGTVKIKTSSNLVFEKNIFALGKVVKRGSSVVSIPVKINSDAPSGELMKAELELNLPGDKYQSARVEKLSLVQELMLNPKAATNLTYDPSPRIKGVFRYYRHTITVELNPAVEDMKEGYEISLVADGEAAPHMTQYKTSHKTNRLRLNQVEKVNFDYALKKSADNKLLKVNLQISYQGRVIKTEVLELRPH